MTKIPQDTKDLIKECITLVKQNKPNGIKDTTLEGLYEKLEEKNIEGYKKYWEFKFENNNMYQMMEEEILDAINYGCYELIKLNRIGKKVAIYIKDLEKLVQSLIVIYNNIDSIRINKTEQLDKHFNL